MGYEYEINELAKEESWRMFRIMGELVEGFEAFGSRASDNYIRFSPTQA